MAKLRVTACKTEYAVNPLGLHAANPRLFWRLEAEGRGVKQQAYHIVVATSLEKLAQDEGDKWDSGKVDSDRSVHIPYEGAALRSEERCYWKVRVWDGEGHASDWSEPAFWTMGLLSRGDWKASWIGRKQASSQELQPPAYMRKSFKLKNKPVRATVYATALGLYRLSVNGEAAGGLFAPGWTDYDKRVQVNAYDVTDMLQAGDNAIGVVLGDGWYAGTVGFLGKHVYGERPFLLLQASIEYEDGGRELIVSDGSWRVAEGPIRYSDMIKGEMYDARLEQDGWNLPGFDDSDWEAPDRRTGYNGLLAAALEPPVLITKTIEPVAVTKTEAGTFIYDMGQNMVGWTEVTVRGEAGTSITLSHAEMLNPDGTLYLDNLRVAVQKDRYILKGGEWERYEPSFTFHGYRYVELIGCPGEADLSTIKGKVVHSDMAVTGSLVTSDPMVNRLYDNIVWGQRGNFLSVPTDCPQRDERLGWTGDAQIFARTASYNMDVSRFFSKYMQDIADAQQPSGAFTDVAPDAGWIRHKMWNTRLNWFAPDNAGWGDAGVIIPWTLYLMYGDTRILEEHFDAMKRWVDYLKDNSKELIRPDYANYGDWLSIGAETPNEVLATAYFAYSTKLLAAIAGVIGRTEEHSRYKQLFEQIAEAFRSEFVREDGFIRGDTQTAYVLALQFGLLTEALRVKAIRRLTDDIRARGGNLSTGFLGVGYLLPALSDSGELDAAYELLEQETFPSWMYSIKHGATTIWERWDGWTEDKGFQTPSMNSFNHYSLGSVGEWLFRYMAGIEADPAEPGFRHVVIRPRPGGRLRKVKAGYESLYGPITVEWTLSDDARLELEVTVPANARATVYVPGTAVSEDGVVGERAEYRGAREDRAVPCTVYRVGSGQYRFSSMMPAHADLNRQQAN